MGEGLPVRSCAVGMPDLRGMDVELDHCRAWAEYSARENHCAYHCPDCGSSWTMTGYGRPWHEPWCLGG